MIGTLNQEFRTFQKTAKRRGGNDAGHKAGSRLELVVPAAVGAVRAGLVSAVLQLRRAHLAGPTFLLLVSTGSGLHLRRRNGDRLFDHRIVAAAVTTAGGTPCRKSIGLRSSSLCCCSGSSPGSASRPRIGGAATWTNCMNGVSAAAASA